MANKPKILIVDDSKNECFLLSEYLSSGAVGDYDCQSANSLDDAKKLLDERAFDCIIVDHLIGLETGLEFVIQHEKSNYAEIPVILISGYGDPALEQEARKAGAAGFVAKRDLTEELINKVVSEAINCAA